MNLRPTKIPDVAPVWGDERGCLVCGAYLCEWVGEGEDPRTEIDAALCCRCADGSPEL